MSSILLIAFSIGFLLSLTIIYNHRDWRLPKFWLGMLILAFSLTLFDAWGSIISLGDIIPIFEYTHYRCLMMIPISIWMYINGIVNFNKVQIGRFEKILFGFLIFELGILIMLFFSPAGIQPQNHFFRPSVMIENICIINSLFVIWKANQVLNRLKERIKNNYSDGLEQSYNWLKEFFLALALLLPFWAFTVNAHPFVAIDINTWYGIIWIPLSFLIFYVVVRASSSKEILHDFELESAFQNKNIAPLKVANVSSSNNNIPSIPICELSPNSGQLQIKFNQEIKLHDKKQLTQLVHLINEQKLFRIKRLNINECAQMTDLLKRDISRLINQYLNLTFNDFINLFRIEDFRNRVSNGEAANLTLLAIALECGFSSKTNVYYNFKKLTNSSPIEIANQYKNSNN